MLLLASLLAVGSANAAWLTLCPERSENQKASPEKSIRLMRPDGNHHILRIQETASAKNCISKNLPVDSDAISWFGFSPSVSDATKAIQLQGNEKNGHLEIGEITINNGSHSPEPGFLSNPVKPQLPPQSSHAQRASWFWSPVAWMETPKKLLDSASLLNLGRIYISVIVDGETVRQQAALAEFIKNAHARKIEVWIVTGDPAFALLSEAPALSKLISAYSDYNTSADENAKIDGLQLDIEPYLLKGYKLDVSGWLGNYVSAVSSAYNQANGLPIDIVLPFWFDPENGPTLEALKRLAPLISSITVMDYRTDEQQILHFANKFLAWGTINSKSIHIALESLKIDDEKIKHYIRSDVGELWSTELGDVPVLFLLQEPNTLNGLIGFRFTHESIWKASGTSFYGKRKDLLEMLPRLESVLSLYSAFGGISLHGTQ